MERRGAITALCASVVAGVCLAGGPAGCSRAGRSLAGVEIYGTGPDGKAAMLAQVSNGPRAAELSALLESAAELSRRKGDGRDASRRIELVAGNGRRRVYTFVPHQPGYTVILLRRDNVPMTVNVADMKRWCADAGVAFGECFERGAHEL
jgi:hypothetical protein